MKKIDIIRHTKPVFEKGQCYGQADLELASSFEDEWQIMRPKLLDSYQLVISSPLQRCARLASKIGKQNIEFDDQFLEYNFGNWELKKWDEIDKAESTSWMNDFVETPAPNGESLREMHVRVLDAWNHLLQRKEEKIALVAHSGVQRLIHAHIFSTPLADIFRLQLDFGAVIRVTVDTKHNRTTLKHL